MAPRRGRVVAHQDDVDDSHRQRTVHRHRRRRVQPIVNVVQARHTVAFSATPNPPFAQVSPSQSRREEVFLSRYKRWEDENENERYLVTAFWSKHLAVSRLRYCLAVSWM